MEDAKELIAALTKIRKDKALAAKFVHDPTGILKSVGLDPKKHIIGPPTPVDPKIGSQLPLNPIRLEKVAVDPRTGLPVKGGETEISVCGSVGYIVCASVGKMN